MTSLPVGSGLSGLATALILAKHGIPFRIIDKVSQPFVGSRGTGIWPRTQELHNLLGTLPELQERARYVPGFMVQSFDPPTSRKPAKVFEFIPPREATPDIPWPNGYMIWQSKHEEILRSRLEIDFGIRVEYCTELTAVEPLEDHVKVTLEKQGSELVEELQTSYLVSGEGAHSRVRKSVGFTFLGETVSQKFVIGDIEVLKGLDENYWHVFGTPASQMLSMFSIEPSEKSRWFNIIATGPGHDYEKLSAGRESFIEEFVKLTGRTDVEFGELLWLSIFTPNIRMVDQFSKGRVFLVGDAAHVHSPTGGQGLNSGIQDAMNLGWKLASVIKGDSRPALLSSYSEERLPVIAQMLNKTSQLYQNSYKKAESVSSNLDRSELALNMLGINYRTSRFVVDKLHTDTLDPALENPYTGVADGLRAGDRAPEAPNLILGNSMEQTSFFRIFQPTRHTALVFADSVQNAKSILNILANYQESLIYKVVILPKGSSLEGVSNDGADLLLEDGEGHARIAYLEKNKLAADQLVVYLVRPDSYIGVVSPNEGGVREYMEKVFI